MAVNAEEADRCHLQLEKIAFTNEPYATLNEKLSAVNELRHECGGTGIYEYRLANLQMRAGLLERAEQTLEQGLSLNTTYERELRLGLADLKIKRGEPGAAEEAYRELAHDYPEWHIPLRQLGAINIDKEQFRQAIEYFRAANEIMPDAFTYRNLAISYNVTEQHEDAVSAMNAAFQLDQSSASDVDAMLATALSYGWLNKLDVADGVLRMLMDAHPGIEKSGKFQRAVRFLRQRTAEKG